MPLQHRSGHRQYINKQAWLSNKTVFMDAEIWISRNFPMVQPCSLCHNPEVGPWGMSPLQWVPCIQQGLWDPRKVGARGQHSLTKTRRYHLPYTGSRAASVIRMPRLARILRGSYLTSFHRQTTNTWVGACNRRKLCLWRKQPFLSSHNLPRRFQTQASSKTRACSGRSCVVSTGTDRESILLQASQEAIY